MFIRLRTLLISCIERALSSNFYSALPRGAKAHEPELVNVTLRGTPTETYLADNWANPVCDRLPLGNTASDKIAGKLS